MAYANKMKQQADAFGDEEKENGSSLRCKIRNCGNCKMGKDRRNPSLEPTFCGMTADSAEKVQLHKIQNDQQCAEQSLAIVGGDTKHGVYETYNKYQRAGQRSGSVAPQLAFHW